MVSNRGMRVQLPLMQRGEFEGVMFDSNIAGVATAPSYGHQQYILPGMQQPAAPPMHGWRGQQQGGYVPQQPAHAGHRLSMAGTAAVSGLPEQQHAHAAQQQGLLDDSLKAVRDLPPVFQPLYSFRYFNPVQSECFDVAFKTDTNMVVSAPTGAGKTGVMELSMLRVLSKHLSPLHGSTAAGASRSSPQQQLQALQALQGRHKLIYLGPIKALIQERQTDWQQRFGGTLGLRCVQLTGDVDDELMDEELEAADIICSTPEKFDQVTRKLNEKGNMGFFAEIALLMIDEVHLLGEVGRGSALEAGCVCRLKAIAAFPEMAQAPIANMRFVAVSATIPNIHDLATWLHVPPAGLRQYGDELRPCKLTTHVKGYNATKNDFLFERRLNEYVYNVVSNYCNGRPALVFCNSRKGTVDTAAVLVKEAEANSRSSNSSSFSAATGSMFVNSQAQLQRLQAAASRAQAKALGAALTAGVGFHNAAMEPADRELVEGLFKANDLAVLCTTSTLAMGVNLPAHLVVIKGTTRYVGDQEGPGETAGYKEYSQTEMLQMVGRAGRPQFDTEGVAVIMTSKDNTTRYQRLLAGQPVESCLMSCLPEHLNAEVVLGAIKDVPGAIQWLRSSFLFTRVRSNPQHYGLKLKPGVSEAELDSLLRDKLVMKPVAELMQYGLIATDEDSYSLEPTGAGKLMATHSLKLATMAAIANLGQRPNMPSLLRVICGAEELRNTTLRRSERKVLNDVNHSSEPQQLRYHVMASLEDGGSNGKLKQRISTAQEKLFILLNDGLADKPAENLDYSLKQEQDRLLVVGQRIAKCMARYYVLQNSFSAAGRSLLLSRSLRVRLWDDSSCAVRQLPSVGKLLGARLAAAGLGSLRALATCNNAHQVEVAAQKPYPWGSELLAHLRSITPPPVTMQLQVLEVLPSRALNCQLTLTRCDSTNTNTSSAASRGSSGHQTTITSTWALPAAGAPVAAAGNGASSAGGVGALPTLEHKIFTTFTPCKLLCGCSSTDQLLLLRSLVLETFQSPLQLHFKVDAPADPYEPSNLAARLVLDRVIGLDEKVSLQVPPLRHAAAGAAAMQRSAALNPAEGDSMSGLEDNAGLCADDVSVAIGGKAAPRQRVLPSKRPHGSSNTPTFSSLQAAAAFAEEGPKTAVHDEAAAKHACGPDRQHQPQMHRLQTQHRQQQLAPSMQLNQQQMQRWNQLHQNHSAGLVTKHHMASPASPNSLSGAVSPGQHECSGTGQHTMQHGASQGAAGGFKAAATMTAAAAAGAAAAAFGDGADGSGAAPDVPPAPRAHLPQTAIAARYNSMLNSTMIKMGGDEDHSSGAVAAAAPVNQLLGRRGPSGEQQQQELPVTRAENAVPPASAVDAAGLQVSPEHARLLQQQQQQQQRAIKQSHSPKQQGMQQEDPGGQQQPLQADKQSAQVPGWQHCDEQGQGQLPGPAAAGGNSIASMFDMLADSLVVEEEQQKDQQHCQLLAAGQQLQFASSAGQPNSTPQSNTVPHIGAAPVAAHLQSLNSVFGAAVLQQHEGCSSLVAELNSGDSRSLSSTHWSTAGVLPTPLSSILPAKPLTAFRPQQQPGFTHLSAAVHSTSSRRGALSSHPPGCRQLTSLQQLQQVQGCKVHGNVNDNSSSSPADATRVVREAPVADDAPAAADLFTPPKQVLRSLGSGTQCGPSSAAAAAALPHAKGVSTEHSSFPSGVTAAGKSAGLNAACAAPHWSAHLGRRDMASQQAGSDMECDEAPVVPAAAPNFEQFAFSAGGPAPVSTYRPSQKSLMFQRNFQHPAATTTRALAQAKLAGRTASSSQRLPGGSLGSANSYAQGIGGSRHVHGSQQQRQQLFQQQPQRAAEPEPAARAVTPQRQWGNFVEGMSQHAAAAAAGKPGMVACELRLCGNGAGDAKLSASASQALAAGLTVGSVYNSDSMSADTTTVPPSQEQAVARRAARAVWQPAAGATVTRPLLFGDAPARLARHPTSGGAAMPVAGVMQRSKWNSSIQGGVGAAAADGSLHAMSGRQQHGTGAVAADASTTACGVLQPAKAAGVTCAVDGDGGEWQHGLQLRAGGSGQDITTPLATGQAVATAAGAAAAADGAGLRDAAVAQEQDGSDDLDFGSIFDFMK